jgi:hypothetical protein
MNLFSESVDTLSWEVPAYLLPEQIADEPEERLGCLQRILSGHIT